MTTERYAPAPRAVAPVLVAVTVACGLQLLRAMLPLWLYVLRDRYDWSAVQIGLLAVGWFALAWLVAPLARVVGARALLTTAVGVLALARVAAGQLGAMPLLQLFAAMAGALALAFSLPLLVGLAGARDGVPARPLGAAVLAGLALDLALHALFGTYDSVWRGGGVDLLVGGAQGVALLAAVRHPATDRAWPISDPAQGGWVWSAVGPLLFLYLLLTGNIAQLQTLAGGFALAAGTLLGGHLAGLLLAWVWPPGARAVATGGAVLVTALLAVPPVTGRPLHGVVLVVTVVLAQVTLALLWLDGFGRIHPTPQPRPVARLAAANAVGFFLLVTLLFAFYAGYDMRLPFANTVVPVAALLVFVAATWRRGGAPNGAPVALPVVAGALLLAGVLVGLGPLDSAEPAPPAAAAPGTVRVMTYNLHNGFDTLGAMQLDQLAATIEASQADIVALQEVSRGWVVNGSVDMLTWLADRLGMESVFVGTSGPLWGNAVLSRYPIRDSRVLPLPPDDLLLGRAVLHVTVTPPDGAPITVLATHYHHVKADSAIRVQQSAAVTAYWSNRDAGERAILLGDLNAEPGTPELARLAEAGWRDVLTEAGVAPGWTFPADGPERRIDYIWLTPEWTIVDAAVLPNQGSDHLAVIATLR